VLPFDNMTGDPEEDSFCDGFADNLISTLSYTKELLVIARNSSFAYRDKQINIQQIGKELKAGWIIEGSVQKAKENIRITIQLINAESGHHKWSKTYDREFKEIFKLQDEIAQEIATVIGVELVWGGAAANVYEGIESNQEYKMLSEAVTDLTIGTPESLYNARKISLELIEMNQHIPFAYTILGNTYIADIWLDKCETLVVCAGKALINLKKALSLNEGFDLAHLAVGELYTLIGDTDKAFNSIKKAINLNPSNAIAYNMLADCFIYINQLDEAVVSVKKAMDLSPRPNYAFYFELGFAYQTMEEFEKAVEFYTKSLELNPDYWLTYIGLVICYGHMEDIENANKAIDELFRINPNFSANEFIKTMPWKYDSSRDFIREGIKKAGLKIDE
jgi:adenylate cyclase